MLLSQIHKKINFNFEKQKLVFDTSQELFSFAKVDDGTKELLNSLRKNSFINYENILDLGCGYGVMGIFLKSKFPNSKVLCTDRDSLAVEFTEHNAKLNGVEVLTKSSLDFDNISGKFDLIVCNFPAKLENDGLRYFVAKSSEFLNKNGTLALVVVKELNYAIEEILSARDPSSEGKNENIVVSFKSVSKGYSVYHLKFKEKMSTEKKPYSLDEKLFVFSKMGINILTSNVLQEFDTPHYVTKLIVDEIASEKFNKCKTITIINPNQGIIPVASAHSCSRDKIVLVSRDLLQLKISSENLKLNAINYFENINSDFAENKSDLLIWSLHEETDKEILEKLKIYRENFKQIILGGRKSVISRILKNMNVKPMLENRIEKYCVVEI